MKKKILYIHHAGDMGGAPRSMAYLIARIDKAKYDVTVWVMNNGPVVPMFKDLGVNVIVSNTKWHKPFHGTTVSGMSVKVFFKNILGYLPTYFFAKKLIKQTKPDLIHLTTSCLFHFAKAAKTVNPKIKVISHVREPLLPNFFGNILLKMNAKYVDRFVAISHNDAAPFVKNNNDVTVINNFVNVNEYAKNEETRRKVRKELKIADNEIMVSYFARVSEANGTLDLIKMANMLLANKQIKFFIFGFENDSAYDRLVKQEAKENVYFMPMVTNVSDYLCASDLLLSPFTTPHFSRAIVEAAATGIPSIATNVNSQNELIKDNETGYLYKGNKTGADKILKLATDHNLRALYGVNARKFAEEKFDAVKNAELTFKCYD